MKYTYRNKRTGNTVTVPCALFGPDWEEVQDRATEATEAEKKPTAAKKPAARKKVSKEG